MLGLWCYHSPCCRQNPQCFFDIHPLTLHSSEGVCCVLSCVLNGTQVLFCGVRMNMIHDIRQATRNLVPGTSIYQVPGAWYQYIYIPGNGIMCGLRQTERIVQHICSCTSRLKSMDYQCFSRHSPRKARILSLQTIATKPPTLLIVCL